MGNTILNWLIGVLFVVFAVILAVAGWGLVTSAGNQTALNDAKSKFTNAFIGLIIVLAAWLLVDTLMRGLIKGGEGEIEGFGLWSEIECVAPRVVQWVATDISILDDVPGWNKDADNSWTAPCTATTDSTGATSYDCSDALEECEQASGTGTVTDTGTEVVCVPTKQPIPPDITNACSPIAEITDPAAQAMESGSTIVWAGADPRLQSCATQFAAAVGGTINSAYRPQSYQSHLYEVGTKACELSKSSGTCDYRAEINAELGKHGMQLCGAVAQSGSRHTSGTGVDISGINHAAVAATAKQYCLNWKNHTNDPYHYNLIPGCSCN
jgi:hypothetical protein